MLLYELLTGTTPLDRKRLGKAALLEILRLVREEEPPRPSTRLSTSDALPAIAANRGTETALLARLMKGDLDLIVMKALEKDRSRRYETASGLARDVPRYLADEAVEARATTVRYKLGRLIRRNRGATLTAAAMLLVLIGGIVGTTWGMVRAKRALEAEAEARQHETQRAEAELDQRKRAEAAELQAREERNRAAQEARVSRTVRDFLQNKLLGQASAINQADALQRASGSATGVRPNPTVRELLDRADNELTPDKIEAQFPGEPLVQAEILHTIGVTYSAVGGFASAIRLHKRVYEILLRQHGPDHRETLTALAYLAQSYVEVGNLTEAIRHFERIRDKAMAITDSDDLDLLRLLVALGGAYLKQGKLPEAIRLYEYVHERRSKILGPDNADTLYTLVGIAQCHMTTGRVGEAIHLLEHAQDKMVVIPGPDHPNTLEMLSTLGYLNLMDGRYTAAITLFEQVRDKCAVIFTPNDVPVLFAQAYLGSAYREVGRLPEAIDLFEGIRDKIVQNLAQ